MTVVTRYESVEETVAQMDSGVLQSIASLAGAPQGVAELAFNAFPRRTRLWAISCGLGDETSDGELRINDRGREAIVLAAQLCPDPYADVTIEDLANSTQKALEALVQTTGVRIQEPKVAAPATPREDTGARRAGQRLGLLFSGGLVSRRRERRAGDRDEQADATAEETHEQTTHVA